MVKMTAANGVVWEIHGLCITPSDSIFQIIQEAINSGHIEQACLQMKTGHRAPIVIDYDNHTITFRNW